MTDAEKKPEAHEDFELMDREDEEQILSELRGVPVDKFIYKNARGQYELSYAGTKWAVRKFAEKGEAIRITGHPKVEKCPLEPSEHILVTVLASRVLVDKESGREVALDSNVGASRGWTKQALLDGRIIEDAHYFSKTVSKATRNVQQMLLPQDFKKELIETLVRQGQNGGQAPAKPQGKKPAGAPSQGPQKPAGAPAASGAAPASTQPAKSAQQPPAQPGTPPAATQKPAAAPPKDDRDALVQRLNVILRQATGAKDDKAAWRHLPLLTGFQTPSEVPTDVIKLLGPALQQVVKKTAKLENGEIKDKAGKVLWPKEAPAAAAPPPAAAPTPPAEEPPQSDDGAPQPEEAPMF
jgi:hypothetical protein